MCYSSFLVSYVLLCFLFCLSSFCVLCPVLPVSLDGPLGFSNIFFWRVNWWRGWYSKWGGTNSLCQKPIALAQSSKNWFRLVKNCIKFA